jgi:hypothetical protein
VTTRDYADAYADDSDNVRRLDVAARVRRGIYIAAIGFTVSNPVTRAALADNAMAIADAENATLTAERDKAQAALARVKARCALMRFWGGVGRNAASFIENVIEEPTP